MSIHVAILKTPYLRMILEGTKTVESRLTKSAAPPFEQVAEGERLFFKHSGGPFGATATADAVEYHRGLTPHKIQKLREKHNASVCGDDAFWHAKRHSRFATFIHLMEVEPLEVGPVYKKSGWRAWHVLDDRHSPIREVTLTAGAIRNRYAPFPRERRGDRTLTLLLPDGRTVRTNLVRGRMIRWRGWTPYYEHHHVRPGDRLRYLAVGHDFFRVSFPQRVGEVSTRKGVHCSPEKQSQDRP